MEYQKSNEEKNVQMPINRGMDKQMFSFHMMKCYKTVKREEVDL